MGVGKIRTTDLDAFVAECQRLGGLDSPESREYRADFDLQYDTNVDVTLDPFSEEYVRQQIVLYREISKRELDQAEGEKSPIDPDYHAAGCNPYRSPDVRFLSKQARTITTAMMVADLPPAAEVLDCGSGWGLSSELFAYCGARVTAVDINEPFVELVRKRAHRLGLPIEVHRSNFDDYRDHRQYDLVFFYECLHHSVRPWVTLERISKLVKPGGKIVLAGEPPNFGWPHWGLRLSSDAVYCIRHYGWWESGWTMDFLSQCFTKCGFDLTTIDDVGMDGGPIGFAVRKEDAEKVRPHLDPGMKTLADQREKIRELHQHVDDMQSSLSWKLAAPVRTLGRWLRG